MSVQSHIQSLEERHQSLDSALETLLHSPSSSDAEVQAVKLRKLRLKDEIARLRAAND